MCPCLKLLQFNRWIVKVNTLSSIIIVSLIVCNKKFLIFSNKSKEVKNREGSGRISSLVNKFRRNLLLPSSGKKSKNVSNLSVVCPGSSLKHHRKYARFRFSKQCF